MPMLIQQIQPELVGGIDNLPNRLRLEAVGHGLTEAECDALVATLPPELAACDCFLDRLTGLWRYEFGEPHRVGNELIWGAHMWLPVPVLYDVLQCARSRLPPEKLAAYLALLARPGKHPDHLAEMFPVLRIAPGLRVRHEVAGFGQGNRTVDWVIGPVEQRPVILDVKRRLADFFGQMEQIAAEGAVPPEHDVTLLFRSVEGKFQASDPADRLQGAWIVTDIKQEQAELHAAFDGLDPAKVHFAILGDKEPDVYLLIRRPEDRQFIIELLGLTESDRFIFTRAATNNQQE
jgi:hypothetical protein